MFKNLVIKAASIMVCMWYFLCITGFDVHTCRNAEKTFVVSLLSNIQSCDNIHPVEHCWEDAEDSCHMKIFRFQKQTSFNSMTCCSDEVQNLEKSSAVVKDGMRKIDNLFFRHILHQLPSALDILPLLEPGRVSFSSIVDDSNFIEEDYLSFYSVFRI